MLRANPWLIAAAWGSIAASLLHIACIIGGPDWYRFFGAGEEIARAAERGAWMPTIVTLGIAAVLAAWAAFAFSAAGVILRLPLTRTALVAISGVLLLRALAGLFGAFWRPDLSGNFMLISSLIVLILGLCFAIGTWQSWMTIANRGV
ncbi:MAG: hypothetical protein AABZ45_02655 [Pseudomonadota bacterium]